MKKLMALVLALVLLTPAMAFAGSATDAALGLGAFAVFNQILGGVGVFGGYAAPAPAPVYVAPAPVYVAPPPPPPVYVAPAPVYVAPAPVYVAPAPVYVAPAPVYATPYYYYPGRPYWARVVVHGHRW